MPDLCVPSALMALTDAAFAGLPDFAAMRAEDIVPAVEAAVADHARAMAACAAMPGDPALLTRKEAADVVLERVWGAVAHLLSVANTPAWRAAHAQAQPIIAAHLAAVGQDRALFEALQAIDPATLDPAQRRARELALKDFALSGVALDGDAARRFAENRLELSRLGTAFANAVLDATEAFAIDLPDDSRLAGLTETDRAAMAQAAQAAGVPGWRITLHAPVVMAVLTHAEDRDLRREIYTAWNTRASDQGPQAGQYDNTDTIAQILRLRGEAALMLGYPDPVAVSLATKMAPDGATVESFLTGLARAARPQARAELADLAAFARDELAIPDCAPWDIAFAAERLRRARHALDSSEIRRHLPLDRVLDALFALVGDLFGVEFRPGAAPVWHEAVQVFTLHPRGAAPDAAPLAALYADMFARDGKRGGAWMNQCRPRLADGAVWPVAYLVTNFAAPTSGAPATITHSDMVTLFHEMGHCLHLLLTRVDVPSVCGTAGVEWDAVELPSQFLENFAWEPAVLRAASAHVETGAPLSETTIAAMLAARDFHRAMALVRQIEFALFDLRLHHAAGGANAPDPMTVLAKVRDEVAVIDYPAWHRLPHAFSHIFAGSYAAGYYSYLWAERLSADAYAAFEDPAADRTTLGTRFAREVLAQGGARPAMENFIAFRGREPDDAPLLRSWGIAA